MTEDEFKAVFIACSLTRSDSSIETATHNADVAWGLYSESRPEVEVDPGYARLWLGLNWPALHEALFDADHATLLKAAELVGYTPMEPR